jgi:hypothetical protein
MDGGGLANLLPGTGTEVFFAGAAAGSSRPLPGRPGVPSSRGRTGMLSGERPFTIIMIYVMMIS